MCIHIHTQFAPTQRSGMLEDQITSAGQALREAFGELAGPAPWVATAALQAKIPPHIT